MPPGIIGQGVKRTPEEVLLAADRPRTNDLCENKMRIGEMIPQLEQRESRKSSTQRLGQGGKSGASIRGQQRSCGVFT